MLRQRRPPALCGTVDAPTTATLLGFANASSGCLTRTDSLALEARGPLLRECPRALLGVVGLVDEGRDGGVVAQRLLRMLVQPAPGELLRELDRQRAIPTDALGHLGRRRQQGL